MIPYQKSPNVCGFTLIEMTVVIAVLIAMMAGGMMYSSAIGEWKSGKVASETLRSVYVAQRTYLADHPTTSVSALTHNKIMPYLTNRPATFPTVVGLDSVDRAIKVTVAPPVVVNESGDVYDPSDKLNDSLWDVGE